MATQSFTPACMMVVSLILFCNAQQWSNMPLLLRGPHNKPKTLSDFLETNQVDLGRPAQNVSSSVTPELAILHNHLDQDQTLLQPAEPASFHPRGYQPRLVQPEPTRTIQDPKKALEPTRTIQDPKKALEPTRTIQDPKKALEPKRQQTLAQGPSGEEFKMGKPWEHSRPIGLAKEHLQGSVKREMIKPTKKFQSLGSHFNAPSNEPTWKPATVESPKPTELEFTTPEPAQTVSVECKESFVHVEVNQDLFGIGQLINPADLTMGGCQPVAYDDESHVLVFQSELHGCSSEIKVTLDKLIYMFTLVYNPNPLPDTPIVRTNEAKVAVECVYPRRFNVSSSALKPTWMPYATTKDKDESLIFSLQLMSDDWQSERTSSTYVLGDMVNVEGSVQQGHHEPLRVFVDNCVASSDPDVDTLPRYTFIDNHGCFTESWHSGSNSQFMPRVQDDKVRFQLGTFKFHQQDVSLVYITCQLKATFASAPIDALHKSCSYQSGRSRWVSVDGMNEVCGCCESSCSRRKGRSVGYDGFAFQGIAAVGPISIHDSPARQRLEPSSHIQETQNLSAEVVVLGGVIAALAVLCLITLASMLHRRLHKSTLPSSDNT
ncbi:zona pellucida sperm-binding protein 3-like isoform X2 [Engraulis encrasicolus]|uniref:zona pellucida sperm-binding protein 3-like isoform X2 n=1 Tax=Engraulis encrasicolus TaxID=184585 RepID=UPI002FD797B3